MIEAVFAIWFLSIGVITSSVAGRHLGVWGTVFASPIIGAAVYSLVGLVLVTFSSFSTVAALGGATLAAVAGVTVARIVTGRWLPVRTTAVSLGIAAAGGASVALGLQALHLTRLTPDSLEYLTMAGSLERFGELARFPSDLLLKRQFTTGALHTAGVITGRGYVASLTFLVTAGGIALTAWLGNRFLTESGIPARWRWAIAGSATFALATTNRVAYNLFYVNGHGLFAGLLLIGVGFAWYASVSGRWALLLPSAVAFAALAPLRAEAVVVAVIFLVPIVTAPSLPVRARWALTIPLIATTVLWYGFALRPYLPADEYRLAGTATANILVAVGLAGLVAASQIRRARLLVRRSPWIVAALLGGFVVWRSQTQFFALLKSLAATGSNVGAYGMWATFWWIAPLLLVAAVVAVVVPNQRFFVPGLLTFPIALFTFAYLREGPYRVGTGDSANRMLMHVAFVLVVYLIAAAGIAYHDAFGDGSSEETGGSPYPDESLSSKTTAAGSTA